MRDANIPTRVVKRVEMLIEKLSPHQSLLYGHVFSGMVLRHCLLYEEVDRDHLCVYMVSAFLCVFCPEFKDDLESAGVEALRIVDSMIAGEPFAGVELA